MNFSVQEIEGLAPDASSVKSGKGLAGESSWLEVGEEGGYLWGLCKGSGSRPYQVRVDASQQEVGFKCSCPSRKIPCKHVLGLLFLRAARGEELGGECPDWASEWREKRRQRQSGTADAAGGSRKAGKKKVASFAERIEAHLPRMTEGIELLHERMIDAVRHGLTPAWLQGLSRRLVDTQLPGLALVLEKMEQQYARCGDEASLARMLPLMGRLQLLAEAFRGRDKLSEAERYDLFLALGMTLEKEHVLAEGVQRKGTWHVLGVTSEEFGRLRERRVWLGNSEGETALLQDYAPRNRSFPGSFTAGTSFTGTLAWYPGTVQQRAVLAGDGMPSPEAQGFVPPDTAGAVRRMQESVAGNPWLWRWPLLLADVRICCDTSGTPHVLLADGRRLPLALSCTKQEAWAMHALSLAGTVCCFGEWLGSVLVPLRVWREDALPWERTGDVDTFV